MHPNCRGPFRCPRCDTRPPPSFRVAFGIVSSRPQRNHAVPVDERPDGNCRRARAPARGVKAAAAGEVAAGAVTCQKVFRICLYPYANAAGARVDDADARRPLPTCGRSCCCHALSRGGAHGHGGWGRGGRGVARGGGGGRRGGGGGGAFRPRRRLIFSRGVP